MTGITPQEFTKLSAPFASKDHEFNRGFIYIEETAICARIEEVDLSWEWKTIEVRRESDVAYVVGALTINGITRYGTGQQVIQRDKEGKESVGEATKGATTDAMKRAARLFGIGRYLLQCPKTVKDYGPELHKWLASLAAPKQPISNPEIASAPAKPVWWNEVTTAFRDKGFNDEQFKHFCDDVKALLAAGTITANMHPSQVALRIKQELFKDKAG